LVLAEQIAAIDPERLGHLVGHLSQQEMADVDHALQVVLQLP
jgi:mRNA interferase MazF